MSSEQVNAESEEPQGTSDQPGPDRQDVTVTVWAPRDPEGREFTWDKHTTVGEAAKEAAAAFGYTVGTPTLAKNKVSLDRDKQLVAAGVRDGDRLELVDNHGGV